MSGETVKTFLIWYLAATFIAGIANGFANSVVGAGSTLIAVLIPVVVAAHLAAKSHVALGGSAPEGGAAWEAASSLALACVTVSAIAMLIVFALIGGGLIGALGVSELAVVFFLILGLAGSFGLNLVVLRVLFPMLVRRWLRAADKGKC
ncbi:MAG: ABZJ_00895 family protein [Pseudomonadota bacterium]